MKGILGNLVLHITALQPGIATWYCNLVLHTTVFQPGIANHSISQFSIDQCVGPVLALCLSNVQGNCIANHFYRWSTNAVGDWKRPSLIRWTSEEASSQGGLPLFRGACLLPGLPPLRAT